MRLRPHHEICDAGCLQRPRVAVQRARPVVDVLTPARPVRTRRRSRTRQRRRSRIRPLSTTSTSAEAPDAPAQPNHRHRTHAAASLLDGYHHVSCLPPVLCDGFGSTAKRLGTFLRLGVLGGEPVSHSSDVGSTTTTARPELSLMMNWPGASPSLAVKPTLASTLAPLLNWVRPTWLPEVS